MTVSVIGGGLAGCEAAWQLAKRGIKVNLFEMKPKKYSPAHSYQGLAELVCSNSLKSNRVESACGLLKEEMRQFDSIIIKAADNTKVPAGGALAVDREQFSDFVTRILKTNENISIINEEVIDIPPDVPCIIATGPLTSDKLLESLGKITGEHLYFYDAAAPVVSADSIDMNFAFKASRYGRGTDDYINCPMSEKQYLSFYNELIAAKTAEIHGFEDKKVFESCMPVEVMAKRGPMTLAFGPLKAVGLTDPNTANRPYAVVQLRQDDIKASMYNMVGFQTRLKFKEQKRVFSMIPGLENVEFLRYGVMHRNTFINSPVLLNDDFSFKGNKNLFFAGQITGVEGYVESAMSGMVAGLSLAGRRQGDKLDFSNVTMTGALCQYISSGYGRRFQPMNANFGILPKLEKRIRNKKERYSMLAYRSLEYIKSMNT